LLILSDEQAQAVQRMASEPTQQDLLSLLDMISDRLGVLQSVRDVSGSLRVVPMGGTMTGVTTLNNMVAIGSVPANQMVFATQNAAAQANINQIVVT